MIKQFYLNHRWDPNRYFHSASVDKGVLALNGTLHSPISRTEAQLPDGLVSYLGHSSVEMLSVYSIASAN